MATIDILMPADQAEGTEATVGTWLKQVGDPVALHEPLVEITTDKVNMEVPSPAAGVLAEVCCAAGTRIEPGAVLGRLSTAPDVAAGAAPVAAAASGGSAAARPVPAVMPSTAPPAAALGLTPAVRQLLKQHQLDAAQVPATGPGGRLTREDVLAFVEQRHVTDDSSVPPANGRQARPSRRVPHTPMRRSIATNMARSLAAAPHVTSVFEADMTAVLADREARKAATGAAPTVTAYVVKAVVTALGRVPEVNSRWHEDAVEIFDDINIGVGVATPDGGLIAPVIHGAQHLSLDDIHARLDEVTGRARAGTLSQADVSGGTFTISNHGVSGSLLAAPIIIPQPQAAVLGVGALQRRPVVRLVDGAEAIVVRPMVYVTLTLDHRVLDAQQSNAFMVACVSALEAPRT